MQFVELANGVKMPLVGSGCAYGDWIGGTEFQGFLPEKAWRATNLSLQSGLRHFDMAYAYATHRQVGDVLGKYFMEGTLSREDVFLTTKLAHPRGADHVAISPLLTFNFNDVPDLKAKIIEDFERSLLEVGVGYFDLLLMHWPGTFGETDAALAKFFRAKIWKAFEEIYKSKKARAIGVCNFSQQHLVDLFTTAEVRPMVNQIEVHPYCVDHALIAFCKQEKIVVEAYAPLASGAFGLIKDTTLEAIAKRHPGKSVGQIILRWHIQNGRVVLPKSNNLERMKQNIDLFDFTLSEEDLKAIDGLHPVGVAAKRTCPDPASIL
eukprot:PhF_6_TR13873/c0_g1_i2/m.22266